MRKHLVVSCLTVLLVLFAFLSFAVAQEMAASDPAPTYKVHAYNDHLYKLTAFQPVRTDIYASIGPDGVLLVDAGYAGTIEAFKNALSTLTDQPVKMVIATHSHGDHIGGIPHIAPNAIVVADKRAITDRYYSLPARRRFTNPTLAVDSSASIYFNGEDIWISSPLK